MTTQTQTSTCDLVFRVASGPEQGDVISVSTQKCLLQDKSQECSSVAIYRGCNGVSAQSQGNATLNGQPFDTSWLQSGDQVVFGSTCVEVVQLGSYESASDDSQMFTDTQPVEQVCSPVVDAATAPIAVNPVDTQWTTRIDSLESRMDQQSHATQEKFDSLSGQIETLTSSMTTLFESFQANVASPEQPHQAAENRFAESTFASEAGQIAETPNVEDSYIEKSQPCEPTVSDQSPCCDEPATCNSTCNDSISAEAIEETFQQAPEALETGNEIVASESPIVAEDKSSSFEAEFNRLFGKEESEETPTEEAATSEQAETFEQAAELPQEEVFAVESTEDSSSTFATGTGESTEPGQEDEIRDRLNEMLSDMSPQSEGVVEPVAEPVSDLSALAAPDSPLQELLVPEEPQTEEINEPTPEEAESVAEILARMQASGALPAESMDAMNSDEVQTEETPVAPVPMEASIPEPVAAAPEAPSTLGADEEDSSVQDYMNRLLGRMGDEDAGTETTEEDPAVVTGQQPVPEAGKTEPVQLLSQAEFKPMQRAPERTASLNAMREVANQQRNLDMSRSASAKRRKALAITNFAMMGLGLVAAAYMVTLSTGLMSIPLLAALGALAVAAFFGYKGFINLTSVLAPAQKADDPAVAGQPGAQPVAPVAPVAAQVPPQQV